MNKTLFAATAALVAMAALPAAAQSSAYAQVNVGGSFSSQADLDATFDDGTDTFVGSDEFDLETGFLVGAAGGLEVGNGLRVEAEALYSGNGVDTSVVDIDGEEVDLGDVEVRHMGFLVNVIYDLNVGAVRPYIGAGFGLGSTSIDIDNESMHDQALAWQVKTGVSIPVNDSLTFDVGYRYINAGKFQNTIEDGGNTLRFSVEPHIHAVTVGARFKIQTGS
jgi:opacity protein-like surface antigen